MNTMTNAAVITGWGIVFYLVYLAYGPKPDPVEPELVSTKSFPVKHYDAMRVITHGESQNPPNERVAIYIKRAKESIEIDKESTHLAKLPRTYFAIPESECGDHLVCPITVPLKIQLTDLNLKLRGEDK